MGRALPYLLFRHRLDILARCGGPGAGDVLDEITGAFGVASLLPGSRPHLSPSFAARRAGTDLAHACLTVHDAIVDAARDLGVTLEISEAQALRALVADAMALAMPRRPV